MPRDSVGVRGRHPPEAVWACALAMHLAVRCTVVAEAVTSLVPCMELCPGNSHSGQSGSKLSSFFLVSVLVGLLEHVHVNLRVRH